MARALLSEWSRRVQDDDIADLYAERAVFLGTFRQDVTKGRAEIGAYFHDLRARGLVGVSLGSITSQSLAPGVTALSGLYEFHFPPPRRKRVDAAARFSMLFRQDHRSGRWYIVNHHSSRV